MAFIGRIVSSNSALPNGYKEKTKGIRPSLMADIVEAVAKLAGGEVLEVTEKELEEQAGKALPKYFIVNLRKKFTDMIGKGKVESIEYVSDNGPRVFRFTRIDTPAADGEAAK